MGRNSLKRALKDGMLGEMANEPATKKAGHLHGGSA